VARGVHEIICIGQRPHLSIIFHQSSTVRILQQDGQGELRLAAAMFRAQFIRMDAQMIFSVPPESQQGLTERDLAPVRSLIEEVRNRQNLINAVVTWQNAFTLLKKLERRIGLPEDADRNSYLSLVCELRALGYFLLHQIPGKFEDLEKETGMPFESLRACVAELEIDDQAEFLAKDTETTNRLEKYFSA
jgi:hypothetical protein